MAKKDGRLNLRLDPALAEWAKDYCRRKGLSLSSYICLLLTHEKEKEELRLDKLADAEQI